MITSAKNCPFIVYINIDILQSEHKLGLFCP